ncbi:DNA replication licensing factor Mcm [Trema orientale]|uniref:DNA replication licensing factor MCM2 n=1 Tax=Trema orientale TaxID=63057 RepID=A0A2P5AGS1_TREOI|nr:DNA replication licensing factor Mcm [Trema orientale]
MAGNTPSTLESPTLGGFNINQLPHTSRTSENLSDDEEAAVDPEIIRDEPEDVPIEEEEEEEEDGEDLFHDNFMEDYRRMDEHDQYESIELDDSLEDERDLDQIMADRKAAESELDAHLTTTKRKLPHLLHDQDTDDDNYRPSKRARADFRPLASHRPPYDDADGMQSSPGRCRSQRPPHSREDFPTTDQTDDDPFEDEDDEEGKFEMYRVQGTLREWVTRDEVHRFIAKKFKEFLLTYVNPKNENFEFKYVHLINEMVSANKCSLKIDYKQYIYIDPNISIWLADAPQSVLEVMEDVAKNVVFNLHPNYKNIHQKIYVRITNLPVYDQIRNIRQIHLNTMIRIGGVVTWRSGVFPQLQQVKYDCNKCGTILGPFFQNSYSEVKVGSCPECQSKGPFTINVEQEKVPYSALMIGKFNFLGMLKRLDRGLCIVYTTGKGASAVGLRAAVHKDLVTREWTLEGGSLVLADKGICLIDEFDKMNDQGIVSIHKAMEQQGISISKAGIVTSLQARCSIIATANPVGGRYDSSKKFSQNAELTDPIVSRFDVLCVVKSSTHTLHVVEEILAKFIVDSHFKSQHKGANMEDKSLSESQEDVQTLGDALDPEILPQDLLKKYVTYAKLNVFPRLHDADMDKLTHFYAELRRKSSHGQGVPIEVRHIESMIRISEPHARMQLRQHVTQEDVDMAIRVLLDSFISTQKFGSIRKYMTYKKDYNELLLYLFRELVKNALHFEDIVSGSTSGLTHIDVKVEDLQIKAQEHEIYDLKPFFTSTHFPRANFVLDEQRGVIRHRLC